MAKSVKTMIREYELANPPRSKGARMYTLIRPHDDGEMTVEVHAAVNSSRKGERLMTKCVFRHDLSRGCFAIRDVLWYSNWNRCAPKDHWVVDFHESGRGSRYMERAGRGDEHLKWNRDLIAKDEWHDSFLPFAKMLNGFEGTRYRYCGYDPASEMSVTQYLYLWSISPKVELLSKSGLFRLLTEEAVYAFADDPEFAKWLAKNRETARTKGWTFRQCSWHYGRKVSNERYEEMERVRKARLAEMERIRRARAEEARVRAERKRIAERKRKFAKCSEAIHELYKRLVSICGMNGCYEVVVPQTHADLIMEGEKMHNCVGAYHVEPVANGEEVMVFLRKDGKPYIDLSISAKTFKITEIRRACNESVSSDERKFGETIAKRVGEILGKVA